MRWPWRPPLRLSGLLLLASPVWVSASLCADTRFLVAILDAQCYGHRNLLVLHSKNPVFDALCDGELARLHTNYTVINIAGVLGADEMPWHKINVDLVVILLKSAGADLSNVTFTASRAVGLLKHLTPIIVVYTYELGEGGDSARGLEDVETIVSAVRLTGWMHTMVALQQYSLGAPLQTVPVYLAEPGFVPGVRCGFGPSTTTLALTWEAGEPVAQDAVGFLAPRGQHQLNGCVVNVAPLHGAPYVYFDTKMALQGIDIDLAKYFAEDSNATINFMPFVLTTDVAPQLQRWERLRYTKKGVDRFYAEMDQADVLVGGLFPTMERSRNFDLSTSYTQDRVCGYVTAKLPVGDAWTYPFAVLSVRLWAAVVGLMALLVMILWAMGGGSLEHNALIILGIFFDGEPMPKLTLRPRQAVAVVFLWTVFCLHFNSGYRASLAMASINPLTRPGPRSLQDVKRVGFLIGVMTYLLQEESPGSHRNLTLELEICHELSNCSAQIKKDPENMGLVMSEMTMWSAEPLYFLDFNLKRLLKRESTLATFFISFLINKDSPLHVPIDHALTKFRENGLMQKTLNDLDSILSLVMRYRTRERFLQATHPGFVLVLGVCGLLVAGLVLSLFVFWGELLHHRLSREAPGPPYQHVHQQHTRQHRAIGVCGLLMIGFALSLVVFCGELLHHSVKLRGVQAHATVQDPQATPAETTQSIKTDLLGEDLQKSGLSLVHSRPATNHV